MEKNKNLLIQVGALEAYYQKTQQPCDFKHDGYGVFCIALQLEDNKDNDVRWKTAIKLYNHFLDSEYNNPHKSELDCINEFMLAYKVMYRTFTSSK